MKSIEFTFAGIEFKVDLYVDDEERIVDTLVGVYAWNKTTHHYEAISCDLGAFQHDLEDKINEALEEMYQDEALAHEDDVYERIKEEKFLD